MKEEIKLEVLKKQIGRTIQKLNMFLNDIMRYIGDYHTFNSTNWHNFILNEMKEGIRLIEVYNNLNISDLINIRKIEYDKDISGNNLDYATMRLNELIRELQTAQDYLYAYLRPNLSEIEKGKIDLLRKDLDNLNTEEKIKKNLEIALTEAESGHELACGIISARVIVERLEKISGNNDEERLGNLVKLKIIDNTESSKFSSKAFLDAARAGRNAVSHKNSWFPNGAESLSLLSYAFRMSEWVSKYENIQNDTTNTNQ